MNKLAIFVEGYTEVLFVEKLINEIAGKNKVIIEQRKIRGGGKVHRSVVIVKAAKTDNNEKYFILLVDCGNDKLVKDRIREEHCSLTRKGYKNIIGIRDVRPDFTYAEISKLEARLPQYIKTSLCPVQFILSIMEIEAWFLAESTHYSKISPLITLDKIKSLLGFDPENEDMEQRTTPAYDLNDCYAIGDKTYDKSNAQDTINVLDYDLIYMNLSNKFSYMKKLISSIDSFIS